MSNTAVQNVGSVKGKSKKRFHIKSAILDFIKKGTQLSGKYFKLVSTNLILFVSLVFLNMFYFLHVNGSPKNKNLKTYSHMNIIKTPRSNFYNNCNSIEMSFDDNDH